MREAGHEMIEAVCDRFEKVLNPFCAQRGFHYAVIVLKPRIPGDMEGMRAIHVRSNLTINRWVNQTLSRAAQLARDNSRTNDPDVLEVLRPLCEQEGCQYVLALVKIGMHARNVVALVSNMDTTSVRHTITHMLTQIARDPWRFHVEPARGR